MAGIPAAVDAGPGLRSHRAKGSVLGWALLGLLVVLLAFELITLTHGSGGVPHASATDVGVARRFAVAVTSFDHKRLDADVQRVRDLGTPGFEREFLSAMGPNFTDRIAANKTVSSGDIVAGPRVQTVRGGAATFFIVLDQRVTSEGSQAQPQLVRVGLLVKVQEKDHKVASVQVL